MAPLFSFAAHGRDDEKSPASGHNDHQDDDGSRSQPVFPDGFSLGAAGSRLADCLGSICPPCSPFETQPSGTDTGPSVPVRYTGKNRPY